MTQRVSTFFQKLARHREKSLSTLASMTVRFIGDTTTAAFALRGCTHVAPGARAMGIPIVRNEGRLTIGKELKLNSRWSAVELLTGPGGELTIGDDVAINYGTLVSAQRRVAIGNRVMIGNYCIVADTEVPGVEQHGNVGDPQPITIGDDAWLAVRVTVLPGAKIGAGAVITAGSVVAGEIPPGVVAGGIPARVLRAAVTAADKDRGEAHAPPAPHASSPTQAHASSVVLEELAKPRRVTSRGTLVSDFTITDLVTQLRSLTDAPGVDAEEAPFGQVVPALLAGAPKDAADFGVVWTRPESVVPSFAKVTGFERVSLEDVLAEVDQFTDLVLTASASYRWLFVPTWTMPAYDRGLGLLDAREGGIAHALAAMNLRLMDSLGKSNNVHVLDAERWLAVAGKTACSPKSWYMGKVPFHPDVFAEAARDIHAAIRALSGQARKLLVLDLDDTMWGGIVGDVGWENLRLGGHDALGEAFVDFQRAVKGLTRRGVVLGIVSKNEEATALDAIKKHPEMILRQEDFVGWRINWRDKAQNILDLTRELNLGLQSVVFIDDNPVERARVREALPEVFVPEWPEDKLLYRSAFASLRCFDSGALSKEDAQRTTLYAAERQREQLHASVSSMDEWLKSLAMQVRVEPLLPHNLQRTAQLLNKTNQMNLTTRRLTEQELMAWSKIPGRKLWALTVGDKFGDAGLTGIVSVETEGAQARIVDFVLSCRVMGRKVEDTMVHLAVEHARAQGATRVEAGFLPTAKNNPCLSFWQGSGFASVDGQKFVWDTDQPYALPDAIALEWQR